MISTNVLYMRDGGQTLILPFSFPYPLILLLLLLFLHFLLLPLFLLLLKGPCLLQKVMAIMQQTVSLQTTNIQFSQQALGSIHLIVNNKYIQVLLTFSYIVDQFSYIEPSSTVDFCSELTKERYGRHVNIATNSWFDT